MFQLLSVSVLTELDQQSQLYAVNNCRVPHVSFLGPQEFIAYTEKLAAPIYGCHPATATNSTPTTRS